MAFKVWYFILRTTSGGTLFQRDLEMPKFPKTRKDYYIHISNSRAEEESFRFSTKDTIKTNTPVVHLFDSIRPPRAISPTHPNRRKSIDLPEKRALLGWFVLISRCALSLLSLSLPPGKKPRSHHPVVRLITRGFDPETCRSELARVRTESTRITCRRVAKLLQD